MSLDHVPCRDAHEQTFWQYIAERRLSLQRCSRCAYWLYPPGPRCPECLSSRLDWQQVEGRGRVWSFTVYHHAFDPRLSDELPYNVALVELSEGPIVLSNVVDGDPAIGTNVRLEYAERLGVTRFVFSPDVDE